MLTLLFIYRVDCSQYGYGCYLEDRPSTSAVKKPLLVASIRLRTK